MKTKKCTKCGIEKPLTEFHKKSASKDGHMSQCKECRVKYQAKYRSQNKEKISKSGAEYRSRPEMKERVAKYQAEYYSQNKGRISKRTAEYYSQNKEKYAERYAQNKEEIRKRQAWYYSQNKEKISKQYAEYRSKRNSEQPNCVYQIENSINGRIYIGETARGELRWKEHLYHLRGNYHPNKPLQEDFNEYGEEAFEWTILEEFESDDKDTLLLEEARTIQQYIQDGVELYNLMLTVEQLKMPEEDKKSQ